MNRAASARMLCDPRRRPGGHDRRRSRRARATGRDLIGVSVTGTIALDFEKRTGRNVLARLELDGQTRRRTAAAYHRRPCRPSRARRDLGLLGARRGAGPDPLRRRRQCLGRRRPDRGRAETGGRSYRGPAQRRPRRDLRRLVGRGTRPARRHPLRRGAGRKRRGGRAFPIWSRPISTWTWSGGSRTG